MRRNGTRQGRKLEIGPGAGRIEGFETLNISAGRGVDYVYDCAKPLPFPSETFLTIYASHVLEHVPWYSVEATVAEWARLLAPGGTLEIWVPDGEKICSAFVAAEDEGDRAFENDGWYRFNPARDPCVWASGRIFSYGDGKGTPSSPNWHRALFSRRYLKEVLRRSGLVEIRDMSAEQVRGHDHGWINMGIQGTKQ